MVLSVAFIQPPSEALKGPVSPINKTEAPTVANAIETLPPTEVPVVAESMAKQESPAITTCEEAIRAVWPADLQAGAMIVAQKESGLRTDAVGAPNSDGSQDYGCFQINSRWHAQFFAGGEWSDPKYNAQYALGIYNGRGNWTAWYAVRGILW